MLCLESSYILRLYFKGQILNLNFIRTFAYAYAYSWETEGKITRAFLPLVSYAHAPMPSPKGTVGDRESEAKSPSAKG